MDLRGIVPLRLETGQTLFEASQARPELIRVEQLLGVTVDQPIDATPKAADLPVQGDHVLTCLAVPGGHSAPLVLDPDTVRVSQHPFHLLPHGLLQLVAAHRAIAAERLAAKPVCIRAGAAIVTVISRLAVTHHTACHLAVVRVAALPADDETLEQPAGPASPVALAPAILVQLRLHRFEQAGVYDGRHGDRDPLLARHGHARAGAVAGRMGVAADRTQPRLHAGH